MKRSIIVPLGVAAAAVALLALARTGDERAEAPAAARTAPDIRGQVVFERPDGIYRARVGEREAELLVRGGTWPRWSPDGQYVAFVKGRRIMRVRADGGEPEALADAREPRAVAYRPDGTEVLFTDGHAIRAVNVETRNVREVASGYRFREIDISQDGTRLAATVTRLRITHIRLFDLVRGRNRAMVRGCSASFSPDARFVTHNSDDHRKLEIFSWDTRKKVSAIDAPGGGKFDNQFWSNHPDWIASVSENDRQDVFIHYVPANAAVQATFVGDADRPDLYVDTRP